MESKIVALRTPENAFDQLMDFPFTPNYLEINGMRMHYVDEGKNNSKTIFLLHGQPTWSYLYRHMIPILVAAGYRVIAPDLIGFGKSDKPKYTSSHTFQAHVNWMDEFVRKLNLQNAAAFMQDWGGMIGLRVLAKQPNWLSRLVVANTALAEFSLIEQLMVPNILKTMVAFSGVPSIQKLRAKTNYGNWAGYFRRAQQLEIGEIIQTLTTKNLTAEEKQAYDAPFPDSSFYAGPRQMPEIVATDLKAVNEDWKLLKQLDLPVLTLFSDLDPFLADQGYDQKFQTNFKGAQNQPHITIQNASHFLQEDQSQELAQRTIDWLTQTNFKTIHR